MPFGFSVKASANIWKRIPIWTRLCLSPRSSLTVCAGSNTRAAPLDISTQTSSRSPFLSSAGFSPIVGSPVRPGRLHAGDTHLLGSTHVPPPTPGDTDVPDYSLWRHRTSRFRHRYRGQAVAVPRAAVKGAVSGGYHVASKHSSHEPSLGSHLWPQRLSGGCPRWNNSPSRLDICGCPSQTGTSISTQRKRNASSRRFTPTALPSSGRSLASFATGSCGLIVPRRSP